MEITDREMFDEASADPFDPFPEPVTIPITDVFDLHTIQPRDVKRVVEEYLNEARRLGFRSVRIIHGRGHHSSDCALLKEHVQRWLGSRKMSRHVVAYTSARLHDGGGGALYVLLHRRK